jgi:hypothetical protein
MWIFIVMLKLCGAANAENFQLYSQTFAPKNIHDFGLGLDIGSLGWVWYRPAPPNPNPKLWVFLGTNV